MPSDEHPDLRLDRRGRIVRADADDARLQPEQAAAGDEARLRAGGRGRVDDRVGRRHLPTQFGQRLHVAERAERRRRADRDLERPAAFRAQPRSAISRIVGRRASREST